MDELPEVDFITVPLPVSDKGVMVCVDDTAPWRDDDEINRYVFELRQDHDGAFVIHLVFFARGGPTGAPGMFTVTTPFYVESRYLPSGLDPRHLISCEKVPIPFLVLHDLYTNLAAVLSTLPLY